MGSNLNSLWLARRAEHKGVFCKSGAFTGCDNFPDYVSLHPGYPLALEQVVREKRKGRKGRKVDIKQEIFRILRVICGPLN